MIKAKAERMKESKKESKKERSEYF